MTKTEYFDKQYSEVDPDCMDSFAYDQGFNLDEVYG